MADYSRTSRECRFAELDHEMVAAVNAHVEKYKLGRILDDALLCIEVKSEKTKKGLFSTPGPKITHVGLMVTPRWFVQALKVDKQKMIARSARLEDIAVSDYEKNPYFKQFPDFGVEVIGRFTDASENSTSFIGLGNDPAGEKFKETILKAVQDAKK